MLVILFMCGQRPSEVCGLKCKNVIDTGITLTNGLNKYGHDTNLKTKKSRRSYDLPKSIVSSLKQKCIGKESDDYVFLNSLGNPVTPNALSANLTKLLKKYNKENPNDNCA